MKKIAFVTPWYGDNISGGAESELRELTAHLYCSGIELEILTSCIKDFSSDWSRNFRKAGTEKNSVGITVRRFNADKRNKSAFDSVNIKLMKGHSVSYEEEEIFLKEMANSTGMYDFIEKHKDEYSLFVFIPYMFGTTYYGCKICPEKSVIIPCLHDEPYAYMEHYREIFPETAAMVFNAEPEAELAENLYHLSDSGTISLTAGIGMDTNITVRPEVFMKEYNINEPFILYAGRKDEGKNVNTLIRYFSEYISRRNTNLRLVLMGGGNISLPENLKNSRRIIDIGFVEKQTKYNAMSAAEFLCQPSLNESFSLVIMESWLCGSPVLVHEFCPVTKNFVSQSNGGLYFSNYFEFEACTDYILKNKNMADIMGTNGKKYVVENFGWDAVINKYKTLFNTIISADSNKKRI